MNNIDIFEASRLGDLERTKLLVTDVNLSEDSGNTLLHLAAHNGHTNIVEFLLSSNVDIDSTNEYGNTPLHFASHRGYFEVVDLLLRHGANIYATNRYSSTPLDLAANVEVQELLITSKKKEILWDYWILESIIYNSYFQWLPREMVEDVLVL